MQISHGKLKPPRKFGIFQECICKASRGIQPGVTMEEQNVSLRTDTCCYLYIQC